MLINTERRADRSRCLCSREIYFSKWKHRGAGVELEVIWKYFCLLTTALSACEHLPLQQQGAFSTDGCSSSIKSCLRHDSAWISPWNRGLHSKGHLGKLEWALVGAHISVWFLCECCSAGMGFFILLLHTTSAFMTSLPISLTIFFSYFYVNTMKKNYVIGGAYNIHPDFRPVTPGRRLQH